jgi:enterochelin esterase-like enzyme
MLHPILTSAFLFTTLAALAQQAPAPPIVSPEVLADHRVTFRIMAPNATAVKISGGDIPNISPGAVLTKGDNGLWEVTLGPLPAGAFRYTFNVDGLTVVDPRNPSISESNNNVWSLVAIPGSDFMDTREVPHGAVAAVTYRSNSLNRQRRMHIYTPPGYEAGSEKYPVFYLLHGSSDSDDSWSSVGRAGFILDNLIADKKAKPMIVVMPAGHTSPMVRRAPGATGPSPTDEFVGDFMGSIIPYVETHYRAKTDRQSRAIAGLSMGGSQTLNAALPALDKFSYIGVFSSGLFNAANQQGPSWEEQHKAALDNSAWKKGLKLLWFATGKEDRLMPSTKSTVAMLEKHGFKPVFLESAGGHVWLNWRDYMNQFVPQLFK